MTLFGSDVGQADAESLKLLSIWLELSQPRPAVRSPRSAQEFQNQWPMGEQVRKQEVTFTVCRREAK